ncbi:alpha-amylase [bacterium]|nr:alpha-amylase [bacterium]
MRRFENSLDRAGAKPPDWTREAVWYQIMVERFRDGDPSNNPPDSVAWTADWESIPAPEFRRRYGGDLQGVIEKLDYLAELGVTALYLNPIFHSPSHHKYDAIDYRHVDDCLGVAGEYERTASAEDLLDPDTWLFNASDRVLLELIREVHACGMRIVLDVSFNHVSPRHPAFQDVRAHGRQSRFADWFEVVGWEPFEYEGWAGFGGMPVFRKTAAGFASPTLRDHIFAVTRRWMAPGGDPSAGIDGWRLDVANEIPPGFWREWSALVKSINPEAIMIGEIWDQADDWVDEGYFDLVMNYEFAKASVEFFVDGRPTAKFAQRLQSLRHRYSWPVTLGLQNLYDSHDTDRIVSRLRNPGLPYDSMNTPARNPDYDVAKPTPDDYRRLLQMALFQATYPGAPMIWYGTEVGIWGADDPHTRKPMLWQDLEPCERPEANRVEKDLLAAYREILALRKLPVFREGDYVQLVADGPLFVYARILDGVTAVVVLNRSDKPASIPMIALPNGESISPDWQTIYGLPGSNQEQLEAHGGVVLLREGG